MFDGPFWSSPVLVSVRPVIEGARHMRVNQDEIERIADWLAYEEFAFPEALLPFDVGGDPDLLTDFTMLVNSLNFAFTDFTSGVKFAAERSGRRWSDSEGLNAGLLNALDAGVPILSGDWMAQVTEMDLGRIFRGNIVMPMLAERAAILNNIGVTLGASYEGRWSRWLHTCAPALYAGGDGLLERLPAEFPRFADVSDYHGHEIRLLKLAQLAFWFLHTSHQGFGDFALADLNQMTAFADYIVPVALRLMRVFEYDAALERQIAGGIELPADSEEEVEIRAHTLFATALLTEAINHRRGPLAQLVIPQIDYRLWRAYHATTWPHHLTRTVMY